MNFDPKITEQIKVWLETPADKRDIPAGSMLLLRITGNQIRHLNIVRNPAKYAASLEYELQKQYNFRVAELTEVQLMQMVDRAESTLREIGLDEPQPDDTTSGKIVKGKRADHDRLPADVQALYKKTLEYRRQMQQLHLEIRTLMKTKTPCTASDIYAFVVELLKIEKKYLKAWQKYDEAEPTNVAKK